LNPPTPLVTRHNGFEVLAGGANESGLLTLFLRDRQEKGLTVNTIEYYSMYLKKFLSEMDKPVAGIEKEDITEFIGSLTCSPGGKHAYFRAIRAFFRWMEAEGLISNIPRMVAPKVPKPLRPAVSAVDVGRLLTAAKGTRDKLIVSLLADTGLRRTELSSVEWADVDLEQDTIRVWGKGAKQRLVRYGPRSKSLMEMWLEQPNKQAGGSLLGLQSTGLQDMLSRLQERTGIKCNAHALRRTFACESVRNGLNVFYVQSLLGHSSLTMTRIYAEQVSSEDAIKAYKPIVT